MGADTFTKDAAPRRRGARVFVGFAALAAIVGILAILGGGTGSGGSGGGEESRAAGPSAHQESAAAGEGSGTAIAAAPPPPESRVAIRDVKKLGNDAAPRPAPSIETMELTLERELDPNEAGPDATGLPLGQGRTGSLGGVVSELGIGADRAAVTFVGGLNSGRSAVSSFDGIYSFADLYPGLGIVEIALRSKLSVLRFVEVRERGESRFDFDFARPALARATFAEPAGREIRSAGIAFDGRSQESSRFESFVDLRDVVPGDAIFLVAAPRHELRMETRRIAALGASTTQPLDFRLRLGGTATVEVEAPEGITPRGKLVLLPVGAGLEPDFPFGAFSVFAIPSRGAPAPIPGLPEGVPFQVACLCDNVASARQYQVVGSGRGVSSRVRIELKERAPLRGRVMFRGQPFRGLTVRVESHNCADAMEHLLGPVGGIRKLAYPILPVARKSVKTGPDGTFSIETVDLWHPASLVIAAAGYKRFAMQVPEKRGAQSVGTIELELDEGAAAPRVDLSFESSDGRGRRVRVEIGGEGEPSAFTVDVPAAGACKPISIPAGRYRWGPRSDAPDAHRTIDLRAATILSIP